MVLFCFSEENIEKRQNRSHSIQCQKKSGFSQMHKIGKIGIIANFAFPYIFTVSFFIYTMSC